MKTLEDYNLVKDFLSSQGDFSAVGVVSVSESAWNDLIYLAKTWKQELDEKAREEEKRLEGLSEDELRMMDKKAKEEAEKETAKILFHSCGSEPE